MVSVKGLENIAGVQDVAWLPTDGVKRNEGHKRCWLGLNMVKQWIPCLSPLEPKAVEQVVAVHLMPPVWHEETSLVLLAMPIQWHENLNL